MRKKLVYIGVGLLIIAIVLFVISGYLLSGGLSKSIVLTNLTVGAHGFSDVPVIYGNNATALAVYMLVESPANLYVLNGTTFSTWSNYVKSNKNASGLNYVKTLNVNSSYIFQNKTVEVVPIRISKSAAYNNTLPANKLYIVIDNTFGSKSTSTPINATVSYLPLDESRLLISAVLGYGVIIIGIAAIIVIIYGFIKKDPNQGMPTTIGGKPVAKNQNEKDYVDQLYKGVKTKKRRDGESS